MEAYLVNPYIILALVLGYAGLGSWAVWERGDAANWQAKYSSLQASYNGAAIKAQQDAQAQEQLDLQNLAQQSTAAVGQAQLEKQQAQKQLVLYLQRGNEASKGKVDLAHQCFSVPVPADLLPGQK